MLYPAELRTQNWDFLNFSLGRESSLKKEKTLERVFYKVGAAGFEPATSWSQTRRDDRATLHPENVSANIVLNFIPTIVIF